MADTVLEEEFHSIVGSQHMRQWFKLRKAYSMMQELCEQMAAVMTAEFPPCRITRDPAAGSTIWSAAPAEVLKAAFWTVE